MNQSRVTSTFSISCCEVVLKMSRTMYFELSHSVKWTLFNFISRNIYWKWSYDVYRGMKSLPEVRIDDEVVLVTRMLTYVEV